MATGKLTPEQLLAARAIDVLTSGSEATLRSLRRPEQDGETFSVLIPRHRLRGLAEALDAVYPGALDRTAEQVYHRRTNDHEEW